MLSMLSVVLRGEREGGREGEGETESKEVLQTELCK